MAVPGSGAAVAAVEDLHEAHPALDQPACGEALLAERLGLWPVEAVKVLNRGRLGREPKNVGNSTLHPERQLVRLDASPKRGVVGIADGREPVQVAQERELVLLLLAINVGPGSGKGERVAR